MYCFFSFFSSFSIQGIFLSLFHLIFSWLRVRNVKKVRLRKLFWWSEQIGLFNTLFLGEFAGFCLHRTVYFHNFPFVALLKCIDEGGGKSPKNRWHKKDLDPKKVFAAPKLFYSFYASTQLIDQFVIRGKNTFIIYIFSAGTNFPFFGWYIREDNCAREFVLFDAICCLYIWKCIVNGLVQESFRCHYNTNCY